MQWQNRPDRWGAVSQGLHWLVAVLIAAQYVLANMAEAAEDRGGVAGLLEHARVLAQHKSTGMVILALVLVRIGWRRAAGPVPALPPGPAWQRRAAHLGHVALYLLVVLVPLTGWLMASAANLAPSLYGLFTFPNLLAADKDLAGQLGEVHEACAGLLFVLALVHIAAAMKHHFIDRDDVLRRMLPRSGRSQP